MARGVDHGIYGRHVGMLEMAAQNLVHGRQDASRIVGLIRLCGERYFHHRGNQRGRDAMSGHVGHEDANTGRAELDEIVEVAGHRCHRHEPDGEVKVGHPWDLARQERRLNPPCGLELALDTNEFCLGAQDRPSDDVADTEDEDEHSNRLDVRAAQDDLADILVDDEQGKDQRAEDHEPIGQEVGARAVVEPKNAWPGRWKSGSIRASCSPRWRRQVWPTPGR